MQDILRYGPDFEKADPDLITHSKEVLTNLPLEELKNSGIWRSRDVYFLNIAYPSMQAMGEVSPSSVYSSEKSSGRSVGLYIHIPFCEAECYYCHYYKVFGKSQEEVDTYLAAVDTELLLHKERDGEIRASSVYVGGGTPSYLSVEQINRLFYSIRRHVTITDDAEISFEIHPESATEEKLAALAANGVNRINLGVESFNDEMLKQENRRHTAAEAVAAYRRIRQARFDNVNLDLIYGLKGQTVELWEQTLDTLTRIQPPSATLYYLRLKYGTPEYQLWKRYPQSFASDEDLLLMHTMNFERMEKQLGYIQQPVDWFIRDNKLFHRYQDINWRRSDETELLGIGTSAYSFVNGWQYYNVNDTNRYVQSLQHDALPIWRGEKLNLEESMRRTIMLGIKIGMDRKLFKDIYGADVYETFQPTWDRLKKLGLVEITDTSVVLTYTGKLFADEVGQQFYSDAMKRRMNAIDPHLVSTTWPQFNP